MTGYQPIRDQYFLIRSVPDLMESSGGLPPQLTQLFEGEWLLEIVQFRITHNDDILPKTGAEQQEKGHKGIICRILKHDI